MKRGGRDCTWSILGVEVRRPLRAEHKQEWGGAGSEETVVGGAGTGAGRGWECFAFCGPTPLNLSIARLGVTGHFVGRPFLIGA